MEPVPIQEMLKAETTSLKEPLEKLGRKTRAAVLEDRCHQAKSTGTGTCRPQRHKPEQVHDCIHCGKTFKRKFDLKRHQKSLHPSTSLPNETGASEILGRKKSSCGRTLECEVYGVLQALTEPVPAQVLIKAEPTNSNERVEQLWESVQATVHEDNDSQTNSTGTGPRSYIPDKTRQWHVCLQCGNAFTRKFDLKRHERSLHPVSEASLSNGLMEAEISGSKPEPTCTSMKSPRARTFKCKVCEKLFTRKSDVQRHLLRIHSKITLFECKICQKKFCEKAELTAHKCVHRGYRPYQCDICMKRFRQKSALNIHMRVHTGEKPYQCEICMKSFSQTSVLNQHKRVHTGEKPYQCGICLKTFSEMSNLHKHTRIHTGEKPFQCEVCLKKFSLKSVLNQHKRVHTGEKPYQCEICLKRFNKKSVANQHKRVHTGEKPYQCEICLKKFSEKSALDRHRLVHTGEKPYECEICMKKFREKSVLNKHRCVPTRLVPNLINENLVKKDSAKFVVLKTYSKFQQSLETALV